MTEKISCIIVDDEMLARRELRYLLSQFPEIEIVEEARNVTEAIDKVKLLNPQLLFLDISMPGQSGFDLLQQLSLSYAVVFVTAYHNYAVKAFEENAFDYILKPTTPERLKKAIDKVKIAIGFGRNEASQLDKQLFIKDGNRSYFVKLRDIYMIESAGNYSKVHFLNSFCLANYSLKKIDEKMPPEYFLRVNRQQMINLSYISELKNHYKGGLSVVLTNGAEVEISQRCAVEFKARTRL